MAAREGRSGQFWPRRGNLGPKRTCVPNFDRAAIAGSDNLGSVRGKRHRIDDAAVGVGLLGLELERGCEGRQEWSVLAKEGRLGGQL